MLEKTYSPKAVEAKHYQNWEKSGAFDAGRVGDDATPYAIVIPPPNVTGRLHMGHALNNTLQDIMIRYARMTGRDVLWQPGTDHAGIATQMVVERQMAKEGLNRHDLGRDKFIERIWDWKADSGGGIIEQLRRLGASCDWKRERFTMDDGLSKAVRKVFVELYKQGLIYRDKRLVNWDPKLHTAISDLEVEQRDVKGKMWRFKYPLKHDPSLFIIVATTRPETMLGDTAVAVNPKDERYANLVGETVRLPIVDRDIVIIADDHADPEKGSGAVKITPAHDFNDFEVGKRHNLDMINVLDANARIVSDSNGTTEFGKVAPNKNGGTISTERDDLASGLGIPGKIQGLDRFKARDLVVEMMDGLGLLEGVEENPMTIPYGDRSGVVVEPWLLDQWFVDAERLAKPAIEAVESGKTRFVPKQWENTYFEWMRNIQPWCVSRQIWWGHRIPAWHGPDGKIFVETTEQEALAAAERHYGEKTELARDTDVLDTWFSSALWPFSTLGWPDKTPELERYYPTDALCTGFDIIFFWVARMMMMGLHFMGETPFHTVYIHALVRDEKGQKMSKSKGNAMDPLELIDKYGADALRFTLTALAAQGRDVKISERRVEGNRNFCTKLWNAARFCEMNGCEPIKGFDPAGVELTVNKWIVGKALEAVDKTARAIENHRFNEAASASYGFTWGAFCDWYLEFIKPILAGGEQKAVAETRAAASWVLDTILHILHPIMPFITEELWEKMGGHREYLLIAGRWPETDIGLDAAAATEEMDWVVRLIGQVRSIRAEMNVPPGSRIPLLLKDGSEISNKRLADHKVAIDRLAGLEKSEPFTGDAPKGAVQDVLDEATIVLPIADVIDIAVEKDRLTKEIGKLDAEIRKFEKKLGNENFIARAPEAVVATERERLAEAQVAKARLRDAETRLRAL